jgi:AraC-like DNA-binding protein
MDVLSEVIASMRTGRPMATRTDVRAPWALRLRPVAGAGFHVVLQGGGWLIAPAAAPIALSVGDVVFLRTGRGHLLCDSPDTSAVEFHPDEGAWPDGLIGEIEIDGPGERSVFLCGAYNLDLTRQHPLLEEFPAVIHLPASQRSPGALRSAVDLLSAELIERPPGTGGVVPPLIDVLLFYILRTWLGAQPANATAGWAAVLTDPAVGRALRALHDDPARAWTVEALGVQAGLSRAAFSRRFAALVHEPPLTYLLRWRMTVAGRLLRQTNSPLASVAGKVGYTSEFAFAKAFKREYGVSPGNYRSASRAAQRALQ